MTRRGYVGFARGPERSFKSYGHRFYGLRARDLMRALVQTGFAPRSAPGRIIEGRYGGTEAIGAVVGIVVDRLRGLCGKGPLWCHRRVLNDLKFRLQGRDIYDRVTRGALCTPTG